MPLRGERYRKRCRRWTVALIEEVQALPFDEVQRFYALVGMAFSPAEKALLGCNDRFFLLTQILHRPDALHPWLYERCREVEREPDNHLDLWSRYHYKAVDVRALVPTPDGWRRHGDLAPGDRVFGPDGKPTRVVARTPIFTDADCYVVTFDKGYQVAVSGDHLWTVDVASKSRLKSGGRAGRKSVTMNTRDLLAEMALCEKSKTRVLPSVPVAAPLAYEGGDLPLHPYLVGAWLGDGHSDSGRITNAHSDQAILDKIAQVGYRVQRRTGLNATVYDIRPTLRTLGILGHKHIPEVYQQAQIADRWELLRGLMDTDGHCDTRGTATFCAKSEILAEGVFHLAAGLGLKPSMRRHHQTVNGDAYPYYQVSFQSRVGKEDVFSLKRKQDRATSAPAGRSSRHAVVSVEPIPSVSVSCIQVEREDGLYLIGEECITTHNSTIITFAGSIQEIVCDPEITIGVFAAKRDVARPFLQQIKEELEANEDLQKLYSDVLWADPRNEAPSWSVQAGITVRRSSNPKECTVEAYGLIDGMPTGRHFRLLIYDDLVTEKLVTNEEQIIKCTQRWELSDNLGCGEGTRKWHTGTRYSFGDTYGIIMERGILTPRVHPATIDGKKPGNDGMSLTLDAKGEPVKVPPVFLSPEHIVKVMNTQRSTFAAQMLQNPLGDNRAMFDPMWLRPYEFRPRTINVYIMVDPSSGRKGKRSDRTAMAVVGVDHAGNLYLLDGYCHRMRPHERRDCLMNLWRKWNKAPGVMSCQVGYEAYGYQQTDIFELDRAMEKGEYKEAFDIRPLTASAEQDQSKKGRVARLEPEFMASKFFMPAKVWAPDVHLVDEHGEPRFDEWGGQIRGQATCVWEINPENGNTVLAPLPKDKETGNPRLSKGEQRAIASGEPYRIIQPIRRRDEDGNIYDLTRMFFEEYKAFPLAPHDDLIDAVSRIYDMEYVAPSSAYEERNYIDRMMTRAS